MNPSLLSLHLCRIFLDLLVKRKNMLIVSKRVYLLFLFITVAFKDLWGDFKQQYYFLVRHSMSVEACTALVHSYCTVVKHSCHVSSMQERNSHFYSISWCQKWHVFRKTSKKCTRNSSSKNCGTFHFRDFQFSIFDLLDSITAIFKSQISRFSRKTYFLAPKRGVD